MVRLSSILFLFALVPCAGARRILQRGKEEPAAAVLPSIGGFSQNLAINASKTQTVGGFSQLSATNATKTKTNCSALRNLSVRGHDVGKVVEFVCLIWPFGEFPITTTEQVVELLEGAFGHGGMFEKLSEIAMERRKGEFCWRRGKLREPLESIGHTCPGVVNESEHSDELGENDFQKLDLEKHTAWMCKNSSALDEENCMCTQQDQQGETGNKAIEVIHALPSGCDMVHRDVCYESNHPVNCGFGCANDAGNCATVVRDQVGEVVKIVGKVAAFMFANPAIAKAVDAIVAVTEFALTVLKKLVVAGLNTWKRVSELEGDVGLLVVILQYVIEIGKETFEDIMEMKALFQDTFVMIMELAHADWKLADMDINLIGNKLLENGAQVLLTLYQLIKAFIWPMCDAADDSAVFTIESVGEKRLLGPWMERGLHSGRKRYTKVNDSNTRIEWSKSRVAWRAYVDNTWFGFNRKTLYQSDENQLGIPTKNWEANKGADPPPTIFKLGN